MVKGTYKHDKCNGSELKYVVYANGLKWCCFKVT